MALFKVLISASTIATALAAPYLYRRQGNYKDNDIHTLGDAAAQCGNHQELLCCSGSSQGPRDTLSDLLGDCNSLPLEVIGYTIPITQACSNQLACCTGNSNGLVNLACTIII